MYLAIDSLVQRYATSQASIVRCTLHETPSSLYHARFYFSADTVAFKVGIFIREQSIGGYGAQCGSVVKFKGQMLHCALYAPQ